MTSTISLLDDTQKIRRLIFPQDRPYDVGDHIDRIEAYHEAGQGGYVPWFAIYSKGNKESPSSRVNGAHVQEVVYEDKELTPNEISDKMFKL